MLAENSSFAAFAPGFARFPFETLIYPCRDLTGLAGLTEEERRDLAAIILKMGENMMDCLEIRCHS